jgi:hypothetical protein
MDGTDPMNQQANEVPTTHVFFDWYGGPWQRQVSFISKKRTTPPPPSPMR